MCLSMSSDQIQLSGYAPQSHTYIKEVKENKSPIATPIWYLCRYQNKHARTFFHSKCDSSLKTLKKSNVWLN